MTTATKMLYRVRIARGCSEPALESVPLESEDEHYWYIPKQFTSEWANWGNAVNKRREDIAFTPAEAWTAYLHAKMEDEARAQSALAEAAKQCALARAALAKL